MERHLESVLRNPSFHLLLVEHPDLWARLSMRVIAQLAQSKRCPVAFASWLLRQPDRSRSPQWPELYLNGALPSSVRRQSFLARPGKLRGPLSRNALAEFLPADELSLLLRGGLQWRVPTREGRLERITAEEFEQLAALGRRGQSLAGWHPECPEALLCRLFDLGETSVLMNARLPAAKIAEVLASPERRRRRLALFNEAVTADQLRAALGDPDAHLSLVSHPHLPADAMLVLATTGSQEVRRYLAHHPELTDEAQRALETFGTEP
jgi:hypothetical protein